MLVSWAVPKGPTLDPAARRLAVHVEDHPLDYYDFEGVIAAGEYGGGDVIVWDWGTWSLAEGATRSTRSPRVTSTSRSTARSSPGASPWCDAGPTGASEWLLIKKRDDAAVAGWDPEDHPRSVKSGRTNDEVRDAPAASWTGRRTGPGRPTTSSPPSMPSAAPGRGRSASATSDWRDLDEVRLPGRGRGGRPLTTRDLVRHHAVMAPAMLPYLADRPLDPHPRRREGTAEIDGAARAPPWLRRWLDDDAQARIVPDSAAALAWLAARGAVELRPSAATVDEPSHPTWALFDIVAGDGDPTTVLDLARLHRAALRHLGVDGRPVLTGNGGIQVWVPVAARYTFEQTRRWVEAVSQAVAATVPDMVARGAPRRRRECARRDAGRPVRGPRRGGCAGRGADHMGGARRR